jgi:hypothetical protein
MFCTLMLDGVPLGQVELTGAPRAIGLLSPLNGYAASGIQRHASRLGLALFILGSPRIAPAVSARALASATARFAELQPRLSLVDIRGGHIAIIHIIVAEFPHDEAPVVVAHLREQASNVNARLRLLGRRGTASSRPAA